MSIDWVNAVASWFGDQPHPQSPGLKIKEFPTAVRLATKMRFGGHADAREAEGFWREFQAMNDRLAASKKPPVSSDEFEHLIEPMAKISFAYHGRPPTLHEVVRHRDSDPKQMHDWYANLPDEHYPHVPAGGMAKYLALADPYAQMHLARKPVKLEASRFYHGSFSPDAIDAWYQKMKQQEGGADGGDDSAAGHAGDAGTAIAR